MSARVREDVPWWEQLRNTDRIFNHSSPISINDTPGTWPQLPWYEDRGLCIPVRLDLLCCNRLRKSTRLFGNCIWGYPSRELTSHDVLKPWLMAIMFSGCLTAWCRPGSETTLLKASCRFDVVGLSDLRVKFGYRACLGLGLSFVQI